MGRLPARVDWIIHDRTGVKVALRLSKTTMTFQAEYAGKTYTSKDGKELKEQILDFIEESHQLTFYPLILVTMSKPYRTSDTDLRGHLTLDAERFYFSKEGELRKLAWEHHESGHVHKLRLFQPRDFQGKASEFALPYTYRSDYSYGNHSYYLPYSQEVWEGLKKIAQTIQKAESDLNTLLADAQVITSLTMIAMGTKHPLLEPPDAHTDK